jgi:NAD(P)-dependent dehydrogenase (short-subunit alcohol dehydrogenase family)
MTDAFARFDLTGRTAFITGASSGLGAHFAHVLGEAGAHVVLAARRKERLESVATALQEKGITCLTVEFDVTQFDSIGPTLESCEAQGFPINILVNNAGMNAVASVDDITFDDYDAIMGTNVKGPFFLAREVAKRLKAREEAGRIINIASVGAYRVLPGATAYCVSKAAIAMMTRGMAREWARYNIAVNAICPGYIETEINDFWFESEGGQKQIRSWPRRRLGEAQDLDGALLTLSSDAARGMTGSIITVDDGQYI